MEGSDVPFTLAKGGGVGALQFSVSKYIQGKRPNITLADLDILQTSFAQHRTLGASFQSGYLKSVLLVTAANYHTNDDYLRVWHLSNGNDVAMATYICEWNDMNSEADECDQIITEVQFE